MSKRIHETAAAGFSAGSGAYARGRPSYPQPAVDLIVNQFDIGPGKTVVDLAAGTGKFTALLVPTQAHIVAVEPVAEMRETLARSVPGVEVKDGTAEQIPLGDGFADVVTAAQAFHWFKPDDALPEIARVLKSPGGLAFLWNRRDESVPWVKHMNELIRWHEFRYGKYDVMDWSEIVERSGLFGPLQTQKFGYEQTLDREGLEARLRSVSYIAAMEAEERDRVVALGMSAVEGMREPFVLPYNTLVFWCSKRS